MDDTAYPQNPGFGDISPLFKPIKLLANACSARFVVAFRPAKEGGLSHFSGYVLKFLFKRESMALLFATSIRTILLHDFYHLIYIEI